MAHENDLLDSLFGSEVGCTGAFLPNGTTAATQQPQHHNVDKNHQPTKQSLATMPDEEESDPFTLLCTCGSARLRGQREGGDGDGVGPSSSKRTRPRPMTSTAATATTTTTWLESSFVHLMPPRHRRGPLHEEPSGQKASYPQQHQHMSPHGYLEQYQHMEQLLMAAAAASSSSSPSPPTTATVAAMAEISLCSECIDRVAAALEEDTLRLYDDVRTYKEWVMNQTKSLKMLESMAVFSPSHSPHHQQHPSPSSSPSSAARLRQAEQAYQEEILMLQQEVQARESELIHLHSLYKEQLAISEELEEFASQVHQDQNSLEIQAKAFDDSAMLLSKSLSTIQTEVDQLSIVRLPLSLFDLQVDERGLRYPLINQLRLAFRPKGDVTDREIRAAWSHATQLLWVVGTLLQYTSSEWKLVPLVADCAKLIYRKEIFNLKPGDCRSLMAWNALLDQVIRHAKTTISSQPSVEAGTGTAQGYPHPLPNKSTDSKSSTAVPLSSSPPFPSSPSSIGNTELARLDRTDHVSWSQVVHRMASNLLWLSERVAEHVALQVRTLAHSVA